MDRTSDEQLLLAAREGDTDSLAILVGRWQRPLFRFVYRLLPGQEEARDVCQETFLRVLKKADRFRSGSRFSTWMYQIALNLCRDHQRRRRRWSVLLNSHSLLSHGSARTAGRPAREDPSMLIEQREKSAAVHQALDRLPAEQREVLILKEFEGLKFREIAEVLGCPESTVKSRMYYGLNGLRETLERQGIHEP